MEVADKKREQIIEGAIKRFTHFGIGKTTMNDIADDLSVSKPSLYYYFPDKKSLIVGVIEKVFQEYFEVLRNEYKKEDALEDSLFKIIDIRDSFFKKYYMLKITEGVPELLYNDDAIKHTLENLRNAERDFYTAVFKDSETKKEIEHKDMAHVAELYIESLTGLTTICVMDAKKDLFPDEAVFVKVNNKQKELSRIFVRGLRC
ncbi:TetR/AcrR family transcriptional regulator [Pedobacter changchengzhani]|uniref:TetR/AcrR family transcriptional regulator n=2 Tax=Pedobacter changchengzhani TaxID=2529274 RepID=A0A4R5MH70_9SPHI|nr:TetR/AcrR family transcriptional regulator [Pedobacter changchengzhani]